MNKNVNSPVDACFLGGSWVTYLRRRRLVVLPIRTFIELYLLQERNIK